MPSLRSVYGSEKGIALPVVLMLLAVLAVVGSGLVLATRTDLKISGNWKNHTQSFYLAEAGLQRAVGSLNTVTNWIGGLADTNDAFSGDNSLGNGTYVVAVFENDPTPGSVRTLSTGNITATNSSTTVEGVATPQFYSIFNYATFNCGNLELEGVNDLISGGDVYVDGNIELESSSRIQNGNALATGNIELEDTSSVTGGSASANGNVELESSASPNIGGNATAGGNVSGGGTVTGTTSQNVSPDPVSDLCAQTNLLADITIPAEDIQNFRNNADTTISGNYDPGSSVTFTGIVHITGNFELTTNATFSGDVTFIVDGNAEIEGSITSNPPGSTVTFLVPTGNFEVEGGGNFTIDGSLLAGTVNKDGSNKTGGNVEVDDESSLTINGSVIAIDGNTESDDDGSFTVNYQAPSDTNLVKPGTYTLTRWREVIN